MSTYLGDVLIAGVGRHTESNSHNLLDFKWSDHIINSMEWLRSDTFSWQSGDVYVSVYQHLVADISGKSLQSETIGSTTVQFYLADDGHKICPASQESNVSAIYTATGVAWYYIIDTNNTRFKLPRTNNHGTIVEKGQNGSDWYRVYADGWVEQGGWVVSGAVGSYLVQLPKQMADTSYTAIISPFKGTNDGTGGDGSDLALLNGIYNGSYPYGKTTTQIRVSTYSQANNGFNWEVKGYGTNTPKDNQHKYLYFYVGQFSQSATEQTAGLNSELFNGKADLNLSNAVSNASQTAKEAIVGWATPNWSAGIEKSFGTTYTAETNGFIKVYTPTYNSSLDLYITIDGVQMASCWGSTNQRINSNFCVIPIKKGSTYSATCQSAQSGNSLVFFPAVGG